MGSRLLLPLVVTSFAALVANPKPVLNLFAGRLTTFNDNAVWAQHGALNNEKCWVEPAGQACEDVRIHHASNTAFLACGYPETRAVFYPPTGIVDTTSAKSYHEYFVKYDIKKNKTVPLKITGVGEEYDLITHGLDIYVPKGDQSQIYLFAVNHQRSGEVISVFSHKIGTDSLTFVKDFKHPLIKTPNAVAAASLNSFYITNDHHYYPGFLRSLEHKYGPFTWATEVVFCSAEGGANLECKKVTAPSPGVNGALLVDDGKQLMINDVLEGTTSIYEVNQETHDLRLLQKVYLGAHCDNLSEIPGGDLLVSIFPSFDLLWDRLSHPLDKSKHAPAAALRLVKSKGYAPELLYWDDGALLSVLTGSVVDPVNKRFIGGTVIDDHFVVCDISDVDL